MNRWPAGDSRPLALLVLVAAGLRLPFLATSLGFAVDGDTAIVGLMARHLGEGTTLWGQPYGSPLDSWLAAPFVGLLGPSVLALRLPYFLLGLLVVPLTHALAAEVDGRAALPAAALAACPPAYFLLLSALPVPFYPTLVLLSGLLLLLGLRTGRRLRDGGRPWAALVLWGATAGLALWTHLGSAAAVAGSAVAVALGWWRRRRGGARVAPWVGLALAALVLASAPAWTRALADREAASAVGVADDLPTALDHAATLLPRLHRPLLSLVGGDVPLTIDDPEQRVFAPAWARALLALGYLGSLLLALRRRAWRGPGAVLAGTAALVVLAFPFSSRSGPEAVRFLTPAYLPLAVLVAWAHAGHRLRASAVVVLLGALHLGPAVGLLRAWRAPGPAHPLVPECADVLAELEARGLTRAYASYNTAYCLTYLGGERVIASQPWNERFYGHPLPYLDEVRSTSRVAWVLVPGADFELPSPPSFEAKLRALGGTYERIDVGGAAVLFGFEPPFPPAVQPWPGSGAAGDARLDTALTLGGSPLTLHRPSPEPVAGLTLVGAPGGPGLPPGLVVEVSHDGTTFERVLRRRPGREVFDLMWVNGHPQAVTDGSLASVALDGRPLAALRLTAVPAREWALAEVLVHPPGPTGPWPEAPAGAAGPARRLDLARARPGDAGWWARSVVAAARSR